MTDFDKNNTIKRTEKVSLLVFHCFALSTPKMLDFLNQTGTSVHYIIQRNGTVLDLLDENRVAYHAGITSWREYKEGINAKSIGIELQNPAMGNKAYTRAQIESLVTLSKKIIKKHKIKAQNIVGHSDIAPFRKPDPGKFFPWEKLAEEGIGIWPNGNVGLRENTELSPLQIKKLLETIGYNTIDLTAALYAFVLHFMPQKIEKCADIIKKEAETYSFWQKKKSTDFAKYYQNAPKIYPPSALKFFNDEDIAARLKEVARAYQEKK